MKAVVGLGNPGEGYKNTRHNLGFMAVDALLEHFGKRPKADLKTKSQKIKVHFKREEVVLCKPQTYMNLSGDCVKKLAEEYRLCPTDILVVCDDIHVALGRIKLKAKGSAGGHKGLQAIIHSLRTEDFPRLRVGIAPEDSLRDLSEYVVSRFSAKEKGIIQNAVITAKEAVLYWLEYGIEAAMNNFNRIREIENG